MKFIKIDPDEAEKLRSGEHTEEELEEMRKKAEEQLRKMRMDED